MRASQSAGIEPNEEQLEAQSIIEALASGLIELHEVKRRAVTVIASLEATWNVLESAPQRLGRLATGSRDDLPPLTTGKLGKRSIGARLNQAYDYCNFKAPYDTWPFPREHLKQRLDFRLGSFSKPAKTIACIAWRKEV